MTGLRVDKLTVVYPGRPPVRAVIDASLQIDEGEIVGLLGPSGCGKSSLLAGVVGITEPLSGSVRWGGEDVTHTPVHQRGFGLVFQDGQLFPHRSVADNIAFGLEMAHVPAAERGLRVVEMLELVGLPTLGDRAVGELSGGERQRVALARSLAPQPRLLALDEPLSSLDSELRTRLASDLRDILVAAGMTAIVVTHDEAEAEAISSRILRMKDGRLR